MYTQHLTVLFSDIEGFTSQTAKLSRRELQRLLHLQDQLIRPIVGRFKGKIVKTIGDAYLATFSSPTNAVLCGLQIQDKLTLQNKVASSRDQIKLRVAINSGEVNVIDHDVFGTTVNIAARLQSITQPGKVFISETVFHAVNPNEVQAVYVGSKELKGVSQAVKVYMAIAKPAQNVSTQVLWIKFIVPIYTSLKHVLIPEHGSRAVSLKLRLTLLLLVVVFMVSAISLVANLESIKNSILKNSNGEMKLETMSQDSLTENLVKEIDAKTIETTPETTPIPINTTSYDSSSITTSTQTTTTPLSTPNPTSSGPSLVSPTPSPTPIVSASPSATSSPSPDEPSKGGNKGGTKPPAKE